MPPAVRPVSHERNIFSDQQESELGEVIAEGLPHEIIVIDDDTPSAHLQQIGKRLTEFLPPNQFRFQFFLVDMADTNAFSLPGGRIYVSRKLIAFAESDDEIAGVLAHELGHVVTHQGAIHMTTLLRLVLGVTSLGERDDVSDKFQKLMESWRRKPLELREVHDESDRDQLVADQVAIFSMARAGYAPSAFASFWDRFSQTKGNSGSWVTDFFGGVKPEQKRLREIIKNTSALPPGCSPVPARSPEEFRKWQTEVVQYDANSNHESLPGLISREQLTLPLRPDLVNLRFSPDGKYAIAQDEGGIHVLSREPFSELFFIPAQDSYNASFSPDSKSVVFHSSSLRIEKWDIASGKRNFVKEVAMRDPCVQSALSPGGEFLACLEPDLSLAILDVATGNAVVTRKDFFSGPVSDSLLRWNLCNLEFSPDGRFFLAGTTEFAFSVSQRLYLFESQQNIFIPAPKRSSFAFDLHEKKELPLPPSLKAAVTSNFVFLAADRILGVNAAAPGKSPVLSFPGGEHLSDVPLEMGVRPHAPAHGDYVVASDIKGFARGVIDLKTSALFIYFDQDAGDIYDRVALQERRDGEVALLDLDLKKTVASLQLGHSTLAGVRTTAVSGDFSQLAMSTRSRGAVWDLTRNLRVQYVRGFRGGWFDTNHSFFADFPKHKEMERSILRINPSGEIAVVLPVKSDSAYQEGPYLANEIAKDDTHRGHDTTFELTDFGATSVWSRHFPHEVPKVSWNPNEGLALLAWPLADGSGREELRNFPDLKGKGDREDVLLELIDLRKNGLAGKILVKTNRSSFLIHQGIAERDWVVLGVDGNRVLVFSVRSGEQIGHVFGVAPILSASGGRFAVTAAASANEIDVYDLASAKLQRRLKFSSGVLYKSFSPDGMRLFVLTSDEVAYVLDIGHSDTASSMSAH